MRGQPDQNKQGQNVYDVIIVGGGIVGSMIARELSKYKGRFALVEKEPSTGFGVSKANPSMLHSAFIFPSGPLRHRLTYNAASRYRKLAGELDVVFREVDEIFVALNSSQLEKLRSAKKWAEENRLPGGHRMIGAGELLGIEPHVSRKAIGALHGKGVGGIYAPEWTFALTENAAQNGLELYLNTQVNDIIREKDFRYKVITSRGILETRYIVNAAGLFVDEVARMVGDNDINLILTKGVMAILDKSVSHLVRNMVYGSYGKDHSQLVTPTTHANILIGMGYFTTPEHKRDTKVSGEKLREVVEMAKELVPAISGKDVITSFAGIRSENTKAQVSGDFYIEESEHAPGVIHAVIGSPGLTAAPAIAEHVVQLLSRAGMAMEEKKNFRKYRTGWRRFDGASFSEKEQMLASDPNYGHVVCRCEHVTEAEILEAIRRGADTTDAVKHLTGAGMGRCQGGFCGTCVLNYLAGHLGVPPSEVTKKGKGSYQVSGFTKRSEPQAKTK